MSEETIVRAVTEHFGSENAEEIADSMEQSPYGYGEMYSFEVDGEEWNAYPSYSDAVDAAIESIKDSMQDDPESYSGWLENYMELSDGDRRQIAIDEAQSRIEDIRYQPDEHLDELEVPEEYRDDPEEWDGFEESMEELEESFYDRTYRELEDPIEYFVGSGMYSMEDLVKANFMNVNFERAAEEAVDADGWAHFLSSYDGNYEEVDDVVFFRG